jgi:hypothetical protein
MTTLAAAIYERKGTLFVLARHQTKAGFWIDDNDVVTLSGPSAEELGCAVKVALAGSQEGVPTPSPAARVSKPLLTAAGVGSWATFMKASKHVGVWSNEDALELTPYRSKGARGGFEQQPSVALPRELPALALGQVILEALSRAG